jgi:hypothetical protein
VTNVIGEVNIPTPINVCFRGHSGHRTLKPLCLLLTQSGH